MKLAGKVALITGGGSSIGRAIAVHLAELGAKIVIADIDEARCDEAVRTVVESGGAATASNVDVTDEDQVQTMIGDAIVSYGALHVLINGASHHVDGDALTMGNDAWRKSLQVNLESAWLCTRYAAPFLKTSGSGSVIHLAQSDVLQSMPRRFPYSVTRSGILAMSRALSIDFGPQGIRSNVVVVGYIQTNHSERELAESSDPEGDFRRILSVHPLGRVGAARDVARATAFLASDDSSFITGSVLTVDGGRSAVIQDLHNWVS